MSNLLAKLPATDLDTELLFYSACMSGTDSLTGKTLEAAWRIQFQPFYCGRTRVEGLSLAFGRQKDAESGIAALKNAGILTLRQLLVNRKLVDRIVAEALQW